MIKEIIKDTEFLTQKSDAFVFGKDDYLINDLIDTAEANKDRCLGLASIQIGVPKKIILVRKGDKFILLINPLIIHKSTKTYIAKESCLSLEGTRTVKRHRAIKIIYADITGKKKAENIDGLLAQIIQHECDHLKGVLI